MKKHAVLVGINGYKCLGQLRYARQDAEAVATALKRCYGFSDDEISLMTDESKIKPEDRYAIEDALSPDFYANDLDLFVFGFFGHGIWEGDQRYLCPMNVRDRRLTDTALPLKVVQEMLGNIRAKNICLILDCCQNEVSIEGRSAAQAMTEGEETSLDLLARDVVLNLKKKAEGTDYDPTVVVLNSCKKGERAFESVECRHGLFTAELLEAMEKRCKSTSELCEYVRDNVPKALRVSGVHQTPYYTCAGGADIVLPAVKKGYDVFLSYRREGGSVLAKLIQTQLESRNLRVFLDIDESMAGCTFDERLLTRIEESACFVPVLSPGCFGRSGAMSDEDWVYKEILHAIRVHKPIVPVFAPGFEWEHERVPQRIEWLSKIDGIGYHPVYVDAFLDHLAKAVRQPSNLNYKAILEQMTATVEKQSMKVKYAIGGILVGVILLGIVCSTLAINTGNQDKVTNEPEAVVNEPEAVVSESETVANEPEAVVNEPEAVVNEPEEVVIKPEAVVNEPEEVVIKPETVVNEPEEVVIKPEAVVNEPEAVVNEPEAVVNEPEEVVIELEAVVNEPEEVVIKPEAVVNEPETLVSESETVVNEPEIVVNEPEEVVIELEAVVKEPTSVPVEVVLGAEEDVMKEDVMKEDVMKEDVMEEDVMKEDVMKEDVMKEDVMKDLW